MFTGLIRDVGRVAGIRPSAGRSRIEIESALAAEPREHGESLACDGVCLTLVDRSSRSLAFDAIEETLARTTLSGWAPGRRVNLEPALRLTDRLGGHWVQGHVDGTARLLDRKVDGGDHRMWFERDPAWARYVAFKGSIALNGVSLTVSAVEPGRFEVALIPETLSATNLGELPTGSRVNVEVDLVARYLEALGSAPGDVG